MFTDFIPPGLFFPSGVGCSCTCSYSFRFLGKSALHWAAAVNNVEATIALLKNGANKDMQDLKVE